MTNSKIECVILRDIWDKEGNRHRAGSTIHLAAEDAMDMIETGIVTRVKSKK